MPSERSKKSASVVPTVVLAMMVAQYSAGWYCFARICVATASRKNAAKMPVATR